MEHATAIPAEEPASRRSQFRQELDTLSETSEPQDRRGALAARLRAQTGLNEAVLDQVVRAFYARVRLDPDLGPIFDAHIDDWEAHFERMVDFWASVALLAGRYHRNALQAHRPLPLQAAHFERWLALFDQTLQQETTPAGRQHLMEIAQRIAGTLGSRLCPR